MIRNRSISLINILGLTLGMAVTFVIMMYVSHEASYDRFHENRDQIYRVITDQKQHGWKAASSPYPLASKMENDFPEVHRATRIGYLPGAFVQRGNDYIQEERFYFSDQDFFDMFTLEVLRGNPQQMLNDPQDVVLTRSMAEKYFGAIDVTGEKLPIRAGNQKYMLNISGVIEDLPVNSSFQTDFLGSVELYPELIIQTGIFGGNKDLSPEALRSSWDDEFFLTFLQVREGFSQQDLGTKLRELEKKVLEEPEKKGYYLQPMKEMYFYSDNLITSFTQRGDLKQVWVFALVALLILVVACINYILLASSQALNRAREVGIRKITGARQKNLFRQVFVESLLVTLIAFPLSLILIEQFRPLLVRFMEKEFIHYGVLNWKVLTGFLVVLFTLSYIPGRIIVRHFARISPVSVINRSGQAGFTRGGSRKGLMMVQFVIFLTLVTCSLGIYKQIHYSRNHDLGFDPDGVITFSLGHRPDTKSTFQSLKGRLLEDPRIAQAGGCMWVPPTSNTMSFDLSLPEHPDGSVSINALYVDRHFTETLGIEVLEGKPFSAYSEEHKGLILINETARRKLGFDQPVGRKLRGFEIAGVIRDFHYNSYRQKIPPMMLVEGSHNARHMLVKLSEPVTASQVMPYIEETYRSLMGGEAFQAALLSDRFNQIYKSERKLALLLAVLSAVAIVIASMGLVGLTIFQTRKRTREIAIRKVNGALIPHVMGLLSGNYIRMVLLSALFAIPISYWLLQQWIRDFAYQTNIAWWLFGASLALALIITVTTVSFQTWRAATANPAESLRYE